MWLVVPALPVRESLPHQHLPRGSRSLTDSTMQCMVWWSFLGSIFCYGPSADSTKRKETVIVHGQHLLFWPSGGLDKTKKTLDTVCDASRPLNFRVVRSFTDDVNSGFLTMAYPKQKKMNGPGTSIGSTKYKRTISRLARSHKARHNIRSKKKCRKNETNAHSDEHKGKLLFLEREQQPYQRRAVCFSTH